MVVDKKKVILTLHKSGCSYHKETNLVLNNKEEKIVLGKIDLATGIVSSITKEDVDTCDFYGFTYDLTKIEGYVSEETEDPEEVEEEESAEESGEEEIIEEEEVVENPNGDNPDYAGMLVSIKRHIENSESKITILTSRNELLEKKLRENENKLQAIKSLMF